jgi:3-dehydroquinate dehydratase-2
MASDELLGLIRSKTTNWQIGVINGTNMANLINRDPDVFGPKQTIEELESWVADVGRSMGVTISSMHSNHDGEFIEWINARAYTGKLHGIVINPAGLTNYAEHIRHCLADSGLPYIEVHYANMAVTGHQSVFTKSAIGISAGFRKYSYASALLALVGMLDSDNFAKPKHYRAPQL